MTVAAKFKSYRSVYEFKGDRPGAISRTRTTLAVACLGCDLVHFMPTIGEGSIGLTDWPEKPSTDKMTMPCGWSGRLAEGVWHGAA